MSKKTIAEAAIEALVSQGMQEGSIVKVTHKVPTRVGGFKDSWMTQMDSAIGKTLQVAMIKNYEGTVNLMPLRGVDYGGKDVHYNYPAQCLELVEARPTVEVKLNSEYTAKINFEKEYVEVGCQKIFFSRVRQLAEAIEKGRP